MREPSVLGLKPTGVHHLTQALLGKGLEVIIHLPARDEGGAAARGLMDVLSGTLGAEPPTVVRYAHALKENGNETTSPDGRRVPRTVSVPEFRIFEAINEANREFRTQRYEWATLCLEFASHRHAASRHSLSRIAFEAGFADQSHFTNTFRRLVGVSPGVFRTRFAASRGRPASRFPFPR